ncbi:general substrate transporter [Cystobasidium minutum MCA 4210]|uniref:general substrate transporter n=1 Tax=Cystobasidium minutum MCA 4210 TaxID=1397322 RepID=UPI0034CDD38D|eukprot:jgi/Rhomi1/165270/fgenesh1_kg.1_\
MQDFLLRFAECGNVNDYNTCRFKTGIEGLIVGLLSIGTLFGALLGALVADKFGRRNAMSMECTVFTIGVIIQLASVSAWYQFAIGRFIAGLGVGALSAAVPLYQAETAPKAIRGTLTATYQLFITAGILVAYCFAIGTRELDEPPQRSSASWRIVVGLGIFFAAVLGISIQFMPESPRWLLRQNRPEEALASIERVKSVPRGSKDPEVEKMFHEQKDAIDYENQVGKAGWIDCFRRPNKTLYRTILGMTLQAGQQLTGANYFFYDGATVFQSVGIEDSFVTQIILGAVNFGCTFLGLYIMERFGRRWPLIIGGLWQSAWLFVYAAAGTAEDPEENQGIGTLLIVSSCLFILGYASTWAPGIWILIGETFPTRTRAKQGALATASNWLWNFLIAFFTPFITRAIGFSYGFVFAGCNLANAIIVFFFLYESAGISLEAVDYMYNDPRCNPINSGKWVPPGYASRQDLSAQADAMERRKPLEKRLENSGPNGNHKPTREAARPSSDETTLA